MKSTRTLHNLDCRRREVADAGTPISRSASFGLDLERADQEIGVPRVSRSCPHIGGYIKRLVFFTLFFVLLNCNLQAASNATNATAAKAPATAREFFNAGVKKLSGTNLADAEAMFQAALAKQDEAVQPQALYNLGQVRFAEGSEELKKSPPPGQTKARSDHAAGSADGAIQSAEAALAENDVQKMVDAYLRGRGARRELRAAYDAVQQALEEHGRTLQKWRRALGDFQGAAELKPADTNAAYNASVVEQNIAALVDTIRQMQMAGAGAAQQGAKLKDLLSKLKGKIPGDQMPPGAPGDDGEEDPGGHTPDELRDTAEGVSRDGKEMEITLSPEEAGNLLNGFQLGGDRQLPMAKGDAGQPKDRKLRDW